MTPIKCRLIEHIGIRYDADIYWDDGSDHHHRITIDITKEDWDMHDLDKLKDKYISKGICSKCGKQAPPEANIASGERKVWNTEDGENNHIGDMYYTPWLHSEENGEIKCIFWDNCKDPRGHLIVVTPDGTTFDTDARASNCNKPNDRLHRCWEKHGEPPNITVGGPTSDNGVGSIGKPNWHGYLRNGELVE